MNSPTYRKKGPFYVIKKKNNIVWTKKKKEKQYLLTKKFEKKHLSVNLGCSLNTGNIAQTWCLELPSWFWHKKRKKRLCFSKRVKSSLYHLPYVSLDKTLITSPFSSMASWKRIITLTKKIRRIWLKNLYFFILLSYVLFIKIWIIRHISLRSMYYVLCHSPIFWSNSSSKCAKCIIFGLYHLKTRING